MLLATFDKVGEALRVQTGVTSAAKSTATKTGEF
jgi:hypothetical protein